MDSVDLQVLKSSVEWRKQGHKVVLVTIVETWGSSPRPVGAMLAVRDDGLVSGSVSGGCVEDDLIYKIRDESLAVDRPQVVDVDDPRRTRIFEACGHVGERGRVDLVHEAAGR